MFNPTVGLIIPAYQAEKTIDNCIQGLLDQTYTNWKAIIVDDGSTDQTYYKALAYAQRDNRIKLLHQVNQGAASARNKGLDAIESDYVSFIDADDVIVFDYLDTLVKYGCNHDAEIVSCSVTKSYTFLNGEDYCLMDRSQIRARFSKLYLDYVFNSPCGRLYRYDIIKNVRFRENLRVGEDLTFNLNCFISVNKAVFIQYNGYIYNPNLSSATHQFNNNDFKDQITIIKQAMDFCEIMDIEKGEDAINIMFLRNIVDFIVNAVTYLNCKSAYKLINYYKNTEPLRSYLVKYETKELGLDNRRSFFYEQLRNNKTIILLVIGIINSLRNSIKRIKLK